MKLKNNRGIALAVTLLVIVVMITLGAAFVLRAVNDKSASDHQRRSIKSFYIAEAGANAGLNELDTIINTYMLNTVNTTNPQTVSNKALSYVTANDGLGFLIEMAKNGGAVQFTLNGTQAEHTVSSTVFGGGSYNFKIITTEKSDPVTVSTDIWDFPYYYRIEAAGVTGDEASDVVLTGDFTVRVQRDNFAKFALFTDHHNMPSGSTVWFTDKTDFNGPIHTNDRFSFARNPGGTFDGTATQHELMARFYNNGSPVLMNADNNGVIDVPTFNSTYTRSYDEIVLASSVQKQDLIDQARGGDNTPGNGIYVANNGTTLTGGVFVKGDATVALAKDGNGDAQYTVTQGGTTKIITVKKGSNQTTVETVSGSTVTYGGLPNGVDGLGTILYVDGEVSSLSGIVQKDTEVTVSSENDIVISSNITYEEYNAASGTPGTPGYVPPNADDKTNLLGLVSWGGKVRIGTTVPNDASIHGIIMARNGTFEVDNYNDSGVGPRGTITLLGGAITQFYGAFGLFNGSTGAQVSGFGRNFIYDGRTLMGKSPPYFPSMKAFIAFTNDLTDKLVWQEGK